MPVTCTGCGTAAADGAKFCPECGAPLLRRCPSCGARSGSGRFCSECGGPLPVAAAAPRPAPRPEPVAERRTTSVLFGDLVSFTALSEARDPEDVRALLSEYFSVARTVIGRYGGTVEKFIGDAVMAVWGVPAAHEDDAERAVRAGLELVEAVRELGARVGAAGLAMRVGVVTGEVAVTLGAEGEGMVAGDAVNTAARVQGVAAPGTVWVDELTRSLAAAAITFEGRGAFDLKGKASALPLFEAGDVVAAVGGAQRVDGLEAPMAGRERELRQVKDLFHATAEDGRTRLALVSGIAGIGKSRLGWEFEKYVDGLSVVVRWHRGRCLSYGGGAAFWAFSEMVRSRLDLLTDDEGGDVDDKVRRGVAALATDVQEASWLEPRVRALLRGGDQDKDFDRLDLFAAWTVLVERIGQDDPVVLLFEDLQHADDGLLDLIEHLLETCRAPLFLLGLTRPELEERRPSLPASRRATVVYLEPLPEQVMGRLLEGLVDELPPRVRSALVARAEGVPLYAVETVRSLIDRDAVLPREGRYVFDASAQVDLGRLAAPTSLQSLLAARLDTLEQDERRAVQNASVLGVTFTLPGLLALSDESPEGLEALLRRLVRKGLFELQADPRSPERGRYRFTQGLMRTVAYGTLSRHDRRARHLAAAHHLETEQDDALAGVLAQHYLDALGASAAEDPERDVFRERGRALLAEAARRAETLSAWAEAHRLALEALALDADDAGRALLQEMAARTAIPLAELVVAQDLAAQAARTWDGLRREVDAARAQALQGSALWLSGDAQGCVDLLEPLHTRLTSRDDADEVLLALSVILARAYRSLGSMPAQQRHALLALGLSEQVDDVSLQLSALVGAAALAFDLGSLTAGVALTETVVRLARQHHLPDELGKNLGNLIGLLVASDLERALELSGEAVAHIRQSSSKALDVVVSLTNASLARWLAGDWNLALSDIDELLEDLPPSATHAAPRLVQAWILRERGGIVPVVALPEASDDSYDRLMLGLLAAIRSEQEGDLAGAARTTAAALLHYVDAGVHEDVELFAPFVVELQLSAGDLTQAQALLERLQRLRPRLRSPLASAQLSRLRGLLAAAQGRDPEDDLRSAEAAFTAFGAPFYLARTRSELGGWLAGQGRADEAAPLLAAALAGFREVGAQVAIAQLTRQGVPSA